MLQGIRSSEFGETGIRDRHRTRVQVTVKVILSLVLYPLSPHCAIRTLQVRIGFVLLILISAITPCRVGAVLGVRGSTEHWPLTFNDGTLHLVKGENKNALSIRLTLPNGKTEDAKDVPIELSQDPDPLCCPVLWYLVHAERMGAIDLWDVMVDDILSPSLFDNTRSSTRTFSFRGEAVWAWPNDTDKILFLTLYDVWRLFKLCSTAIGLGKAVTPHALRSSIAMSTHLC